MSIKRALFLKKWFDALVDGSFAFYRVLKPWHGQTCRFYPSCSCYAQETLKAMGFLKGLPLVVLRLLKCAPWHGGGVDLPPAIHRDDGGLR